MATATMSAQQDLEIGEQSPLISDLGRGNDQPLEAIENWTKREQAVAGVSAVSFGASFAAILLEHNPLVYVSGLIGIGVAPYAAIQQQKITHVEALAKTNKRVKEEVGQLKHENIKLQVQVADLNSSVANLKLQKEKLDTIQSVQGASLDELEIQLQESKKIYGKMKQNLQGDILNNLIDVALACDEDADMILSDVEITNAINRLENIHGLELDDEGIRGAIIANGRSLEAIMDLIKNLLRDDLPKENNLFKFIQQK